jgi:hypothetical protein
MVSRARRDTEILLTNAALERDYTADIDVSRAQVYPD